ncbi:MAG: hypothetical protein FWG23_02585 [Eggerthellaceae bacterium]|jgi:hypothetical protein|nr:hypothetical protein [Eggerthellaceae bacterium]MDR2716275.1 hypothetical protein [Coriobacteriaceae bacterium]
MGLSKSSKLKDIMKNPEAMAILDEYLPGASNEPKLKLAASLSLVKIAAVAPNKLKAEWLDDIDAKLQALGD